jgi:hypothetical protein
MHPIRRCQYSRGSLLGAGSVVLALSAASGAVVALQPSTPASGVTTPTLGSIPESAWAPGGQLNLSNVPDYVATTWKGRVVGYVPKSQLFPQSSDATSDGRKPTGVSTYRPPTAADQAAPNAALVETVYASDLNTVVGHMYPGVGFVPEGQTGPRTPSSPPTTSAVSEGSTS